ncbi:hypothetical protein CANTEDRAFT_114785 [Yamadazyma tenuis ATCC 10573]|uniref:Uncharacterized protein n=1 Tax=Candida tenuis (strain ATCC 10573 / BCRC 21748 / CBS 615 / JCM 9827 / NBRC 10315 / NRRL Y-1498 / VKM Y-70) TaxID=590646 RepID=G3B6H9_CANTC|nr:uncharacterized protein CANTEDRAFT_114785 [Yamadazyma tenuis ATCC 10573]EGV63471.1 hypothetical protein CANTEDRAFT_114785 [Yamadazyma tenuis ATCC 10573]
MPNCSCANAISASYVPVVCQSPAHTSLHVNTSNVHYSVQLPSHVIFTLNVHKRWFSLVSQPYANRLSSGPCHRQHDITAVSPPAWRLRTPTATKTWG